MAERIAPGMPIAPRSALVGVTLADAGSSGSDVARITEAAITARLSLRTAASSIERMLQWSAIAVPTRINTARVTGGRAVLQLGPDEWLILAEGETPEALTDAIQQAAGGIAHALVNISDRNAGLSLSGPATEDCLAAACPLPLTLAAFPVGRATRTLFGRAEIVLWRVAHEQFHIETGRSFTPYVAGLLGAAIRDETAIRKLAAAPVR